MTTNQTIDGVPIATIAAFARVADAYSEAEDDSYEPWQDAIMHAELRLTLGQFRELRALLDAKPAEEFNPEGWAIDHSAGRPILVHNNCSVIEAEQAYGLLELIKSAAQPQGKPVAYRWRVKPDGKWSASVCKVEYDARANDDRFEAMPLYAEQPAQVSHTMKSVMKAICSIDGFPMLTSNQCHAVAEKLNEQPAPVAVVLPEREAMRNIIARAIGGDAYDCTRVWSAWGVGTMSDDDFIPIVNQEERLYEIADACLDELKRLNPSL